MQSKIFSRISTVVVIIVSLYILYILSQKAVSVAPFPDIDVVATTTPTSLATSTPPSEILPKINLRIASKTIQVLVASTAPARQQGLSDYAPLSDNLGMLFLFPESALHGFWMKSMRFSIDMVWIDDKKIVRGVTRDVSPETYPQTFLPPSPIRYVLELNSGGAMKYGIATGTKLVF